MGTGSFLGVESGRGVTLTPHPLLVPSRFDVILSHMMNRNIITLTREIVDPIDEIIFHVV
jgi:hypothetical protein